MKGNWRFKEEDSGRHGRHDDPALGLRRVQYTQVIPGFSAAFRRLQKEGRTGNNPLRLYRGVCIDGNPAKQLTRWNMRIPAEIFRRKFISP